MRRMQPNYKQIYVDRPKAEPEQWTKTEVSPSYNYKIYKTKQGSIK